MTFSSVEASSYGYAYTVFQEDRAELLKDAEWVKSHRRAIQLIALSWGWDIVAQKRVSSEGAQGQGWHHYPIRFYKCALSAWLFGYDDYLASLRLFAEHIVQTHGENALDSYIRELFA